MKVYLFISDDHPDMTAIYSSMNRAMDEHQDFTWTVIAEKSAWGRYYSTNPNYKLTAHIIPYEVIE